MRELLRTTDLVRLSWCRALLADSHIGTVVLDTHTSVIEGSIGAIPRRLMVSDEDYDEAFRLLGEAGEPGDPGEVGAMESSADRLLGGRIVLRQPKSGYRAAIDPVLLAAAVPATGGAVLDAGCGTGAATLCYAVRVPGARITGLELRPDWAALAEENVRSNGLEGRVRIVVGNLLEGVPGLDSGGFDEVMANPPYLPAERADMRTPPADAPATVEGAAKLADWISFCLAMAAPKGGITLIHRADRLDEILARLHGRAGGIVVFPLWPHGQGEAANRVIIRARKGSKAPMRLAAGLVLHGADGRYGDAAARVFGGAAALEL